MVDKTVEKATRDMLAWMDANQSMKHLPDDMTDADQCRQNADTAERNALLESMVSQVADHLVLLVSLMKQSISGHA